MNSVKPGAMDESSNPTLAERFKAWSITAALFLVGLPLAYSIQPAKPPHVATKTMQEAMRRPILLRRGSETMIATSLYAGYKGGSEPVLDKDGKATGETKWIKPEPPTMELRGFTHGEIDSTPDEGVNVALPMTCGDAARRMVGHGVRVPTFWWRVPATDPDALADNMRITRDTRSLPAAICDHDPDESLDRSAGIPTTS